MMTPVDNQCHDFQQDRPVAWPPAATSAGPSSNPQENRDFTHLDRPTVVE